jgi:hypothetical protein
MHVNNLTEGAPRELPLRINKKMICHILNEKKAGPFLTPQGRPRYDLLQIIFDETELTELMPKGAARTFSIQDTKTIILTLNLDK